MDYVFVPMALLFALLALTQERFVWAVVLSVVVVALGLTASSAYLDLLDTAGWTEVPRYSGFVVFGLVAFAAFLTAGNGYVLIATYVLWTAVELASLVYVGRGARLEEYISQGVIWYFVALWIALALGRLFRTGHPGRVAPSRQRSPLEVPEPKGGRTVEKLRRNIGLKASGTFLLLSLSVLLATKPSRDDFDRELTAMLREAVESTPYDQNGGFVSNLTTFGCKFKSDECLRHLMSAYTVSQTSYVVLTRHQVQGPGASVDCWGAAKQFLCDATISIPAAKETLKSLW